MKSNILGQLQIAIPSLILASGLIVAASDVDAQQYLKPDSLVIVVDSSEIDAPFRYAQYWKNANGSVVDVEESRWGDGHLSENSRAPFLFIVKQAIYGLEYYFNEFTRKREHELVEYSLNLPKGSTSVVYQTDWTF